MAKNAAEHLHGIHAAAHEHHTEMIAAHKAALEKATAMEPHGHAALFHKAAIASHEKMQAHHFAAMQETAKAVADALNKANQVQPSLVSRVTPDIPNLRAVPRTGSAPLQRPVVAAEFEKVFTVEDEEMDLRGRPAI
jgi:hypothetical protein